MAEKPTLISTFRSVPNKSVGHNCLAISKTWQQTTTICLVWDQQKISFGIYVIVFSNEQNIELTEYLPLTIIIRSTKKGFYYIH